MLLTVRLPSCDGVARTAFHPIASRLAAAMALRSAAACWRRMAIWVTQHLVGTASLYCLNSGGLLIALPFAPQKVQGNLWEYVVFRRGTTEDLEEKYMTCVWNDPEKRSRNRLIHLQRN